MQAGGREKFVLFSRVDINGKIQKMPPALKIQGKQNALGCSAPDNMRPVRSLRHDVNGIINA